MMEGIEIITGFPSCPAGIDNYSIIGYVKDATWKPDASLFVDGVHVPQENFCIERIGKGTNGQKPFMIFACSEHANKR